MIHESPVCLECRHYWDSGLRTCDAFSDHIPDEIWIYVAPHYESFPGDYGIQFEPMNPTLKVTRRKSRRR
jgi:hypothetical protein